MATIDHEPCVCTALRQATRRVSQVYDAALAPVAISVNQYAILVRLDRIGPCAIRVLADRLVMDRSTLGHLLRPLAERGLVSLAVSERDRRRRTLDLTPEGRALVARAQPLWQAAQDRFETAYGSQAARDLRATLASVTQTSLDPTPGAAAPPV